MRSLALLGVAILAIAVPVAAHANAQLQLYPTRIVLKDGKESAELGVVNAGSATGRYRATLQDMSMPEDGGLVPVEEGKEGEFSAKKFIRLAPRSVTVPPGQSQKFRILARVPRDAPPGEYRTHLHVIMSSDDVEKEQQDDVAAEGFKVGVRPRFKVSIPVIIFKGESAFTSTLDSVSMDAPSVDNKKPALWLNFTNEGNRSAWGDLIVTFTKDGKVTEIGRTEGFSIYRGVPKRKHRLALEVPEGLALQGGTIHVVYKRKKEDGDSVIAQKDLQV